MARNRGSSTSGISWEHLRNGIGPAAGLRQVRQRYPRGTARRRPACGRRQGPDGRWPNRRCGSTFADARQSPSERAEIRTGTWVAPWASASTPRMRYGRPEGRGRRHRLRLVVEAASTRPWCPGSHFQEFAPSCAGGSPAGFRLCLTASARSNPLASPGHAVVWKAKSHRRNRWHSPANVQNQSLCRHHADRGLNSMKRSPCYQCHTTTRKATQGPKRLTEGRKQAQHWGPYGGLY